MANTIGIAKSFLRQEAVWWKRRRKDNGDEMNDRNGKPLFDLPISLKCRWDGKRAKIVRSNGEETISKASVLVDRVVGEGDLLKLGPLENVQHVQTPWEEEGAYEVLLFEDIPELNPKKRVWIATL